MRNVLITIVASIFVYFGLSVPLVYANDTISIKYLINYTFDANGNSHVDQNISLTNKTSKFYTSHYQIILQGESPKNITGHDSSGPLKIESLEISPNTTTIDIDFNDVVVGLNNSLNFVVSYEGLPAKKRGQVWEVTLPRLGEKSQIDDYQLNLTIPQEFGQPAFISPSPIRSVNRTYSFTKDQISRVGVVADFGNFQTFGFSLKYHLSNVSNFPSIKTIVLPPDTNYQRVYYDDLEPVPQNVKVDSDGNWIASYLIEANHELEIIAIGQAHVLIEPSVPGLISTTMKGSTRKNIGYVSDSIQTWSEYWNTSDKVWENTDLTKIPRFTFAIQNETNNSLVLPKSYQVGSAPYKEYSANPAKISWTKPWQIWSLIPTSTSLTISNPQGQAIYNVPIQISSQNLLVSSPYLHSLDVLPPYGKRDLPLVFDINLNPVFASKNITVTTGASQVVYNIPETKFIFWYTILVATISTTIIFLGFVAHKAWSLRL